jgi:quercetin dioxygenase-like cupin family protein/DNA-binding XRE family transcriptional regulator
MLPVMTIASANTDKSETGSSRQRIRDLPAETVHKELGARLRAERLKKRKTLRGLAAEVGISPSAISQIERGRSKASVDTLYAIVGCLGISLDTLFGEEPVRSYTPSVAPPPGTTPVCHPEQRHAIDLESGVQWQRLTRNTDGLVDFLYVIYQVGGASSANGAFVRHQGHEYGLVQSGRLRVSLGFESYELGPGDSISFDSNTPHRLENIGNEPVHAVWFSMGQHDTPA